MDKRLIFCGGTTEASQYASAHLESMGLCITQKPSKEVSHLLLDVPSFAPDGQLRNGGCVEELLTKLPPEVVICGGNLKHPSLAGHKTFDLLLDEAYLAENAYITAECALATALPRLKTMLRGCPILIIGWGRIGKCLGQLLKAIGADVTIAARKETDRAMIQAMGCRSADPVSLKSTLSQYKIIYNTAPELILNTEQASACPPSCLKIDLASKPGIAGEDVIWARGLPGIHCPESSGKLIAETLIRLLQKEESQ